MGVEAVVLVHGGKGLHVFQGLRNFCGREGAEGADLDHAHLPALGPELLDGLPGGSGGGADDNNRFLGVVHFVFFNQPVLPARPGGEFVRHVLDDLLRVHHGLGLGPLSLHVVNRGRIGAHSDGLVLVQEVVLGLVLAHELPDLLRLLQFDVLNGVGGDEAVLADHDGQGHRLANPHGLEVVVIGLLVGLGKQHQPARVPDAHGVGVVVVDVDGAGQSAAGNRQGDGQAVGSGHVQHLGHVNQAAGAGGGNRAASGGFRADAGGHGAVLGFHGNEIGVYLAVVHVGGEVLGNLSGRRDGVRAHDVGVDLLHRVGNGLVAGQSFTNTHFTLPPYFSSLTMVMAPKGQTLAQMPQPLQKK